MYENREELLAKTINNSRINVIKNTTRHKMYRYVIIGQKNVLFERG